MNYQDIFEVNKESSLRGRYITNEHIKPLLENLSSDFRVSKIGESVLGKPIHSVEIGTGNTKVYMWSQMHGNESTCTKALFDLFAFLSSEDTLAKKIKKELTLYCIPIANPDGAEAYTRVNANQIDLNRDSVELSQPESQLLRSVFDSFKPDFCFNLHDQRTIFNTGFSNIPATVSFLAPSFDEECSVNEVRSKAIAVISEMNSVLQQYIPNQVGRFDDSFNINCIGDRFQSLNAPTVLFEAGHFKEDYEREVTRKYIFIAFLAGLKAVAENKGLDNKIDEYFEIPQNNTLFFDIIYRNVKIEIGNTEKIINFAAQFQEILKGNQILFEAHIVEIGDLNGCFGHVEYDFKNELFDNKKGSEPVLGDLADFKIGNQFEIVNGLLKK